METPYLLFLGDVKDELSAKTARGIAHWRPELCLGEFRLGGCAVTLGLPEIGLKEARERGAKTLVIGVANAGGIIAESWVASLVAAVKMGLDIASGLHARLGNLPEVARAAEEHGRRLYDIRHPAIPLRVGTGVKRPGRRLLTVGTDCSVGKMYTTLALEREMKRRGWNADFRATGQTGIFISGKGICVDAVVADFISGATEMLSPPADPNHLDLIEGQGSLFHPSFAGVTIGLLHGAQPDWIVLCHQPGRTGMRGLPGRSLPGIGECLEANLTAARLTNPAVRAAGFSFNTAGFSSDEALRVLRAVEDEWGLPCVDPVRTGVGALVDEIEEQE